MLRRAKVTKFVHIPLESQEKLERIKALYGISHTDLIIKGIDLAVNQLDKEFETKLAGGNKSQVIA